MKCNKQQLIMEHYSNPKFLNNSLDEEKDFTIYSEHCVDKITFGLQSQDNKISICHKTVGCAVCVASTDMLIGLINNHDKKTILELVNKYQKLINQEIKEDDDLKELNIFCDVKVHLNRFNCANLIAKGLIQLLEQ
ncbi:nitrogen fixation protein NIFU [Mycoplasmopsis californica]|uniref:Iron-sulfur cluster assembly scaffold protein n=1 Tax=Mycoplasmopsis equigenitalium TaxID=114883 RepID=A0ABY5J2U9_9BACT|nr:iron-sulfur cluster assembly scaffold protein [Mycoplasmopsis equigenitalium]UUD37059.1 iron-sulfur cluster assembly scaffold protein [Mycoplasmopsis equigenitalium]VEU69641.1 nitrogen fixation protein NIFU [Mycoplasmopsis californica]